VSLKIAQVATADVSVRLLLLDQIQALKALGHDVVAVCAPGDRVEEMRRFGLTVATVPMARELRPWNDLQSLVALYKLFRKEKFDVVHSHTPKAGILAPLAARLARVPIVVHTIHGLLFHDQMPRWRRWLYWLPEKWTAKLSKFLLSQSHEDISSAVRCGICSREKITYLGNGIDTSHFSPQFSPADDSRNRSALGIRPDDFVIGCVGRLVYEKGFGELFEAASLLREMGQIKILIIGPEETDQDDAVPRSQLEMQTGHGDVCLLGFQEDLRPWYRLMDVFVLPSHREGIPRACMEAAAMGRPVVVTDIRGCREVVRHRETGFLVPVRNPKALADAILELWRDPGKRESFGVQGQRHIKAEFDSRLVLERLRSFYARLEETLPRTRTPA
jgi:glycosyltransferase involved in cell wall biosynthesis